MIDPRARIGRNVIVDGEVTIYHDVEIGEGSMIQAGAYLPPGVRIGRGVFIGPHAVFTNDKHPVSQNPNFRPLATVVEEGASIGANATILPGIRIGRRAVVGAGSVVVHDVPEGATVAGNPARPLPVRRQA